MNKGLYQISLATVVAAIFPFLSACSKVSFSHSDQASTSGRRECDIKNVSQIRKLTKILFIVDTSGSNAVYSKNPGGTACVEGDADCTPPTDPQKSFRGNALEEFYSDYRAKTNLRWGLTTFAGESSYALINSGSSSRPTFTSNGQEVEAAISAFYNMSDDGATPYGAALKMAASAIRNDVARAPQEKANYVVLLVTDGFPTDYLTQTGELNQDEMHEDIASLLAAASGKVSLSTVYYGQTNDTDAIGLLQGIADKGLGQFVNARVAGPQFKFDDAVVGSHGACD